MRQRQRLIDACISALHIHGPSRTTVEKVVALADLSPGIVRFYFDSKDAMLVASLAYLAAEFEERVMVPVAQLRDTPVAALERLVSLYLDPDIASPRKVSVWYSFWGEASSRQEYYDICGRKDEDFAALVRDLVERVVALTGESHLDTAGITLGLIGALEVLWQGIAFQSEADIDREAARAQCMAFLRSVFPKQFGPRESRQGEASNGGGRIQARHLPPSSYSDAILLTAEREKLFRPAWQVIGHEAEAPSTGDFLTGELANERALIVRDEKGVLRAFRNACRRRPHALVGTRTGRFAGAIVCVPHGLRYGFDGKQLEGGAEGDLGALELKQKSGLILVRAAGSSREGGPALTGWDAFAELIPLGVAEFEVAADWKLLVEQWLEGPSARGRFLAPNQLVEVWPGGAALLRALPVAPGRSRLQRLDYAAAAKDNGKTGARKAKGAARGPDPHRLLDTWIAQQIELAASIQAALTTSGEDLAESGPVSAALADFRSSIAVLLAHPPPGR
jgi:TetR/AcrR family transcriptional regulator, transcriptional repressor of bet genes